MRVDISSAFCYLLEVADDTEIRFDSDFASRLLLEIAQEQSLEQLLKKLVHRILQRPHVARVRIWLDQKLKRRESLRRHRLIVNAARLR